jgi:glyoxylase-like metal-dependent hydrolase (beta-lactamase superfamily II)
MSEAGPVKLYAMETGQVHMAGNIHFNNKDPRFKSFPKDNRFNPVFSYLVDHPREGLMLLDTGLHGSFAYKKSGNFGWLLGSMVKTKAQPNRGAADQIKAMGANKNDLRHIFLSHLHLDHPSGLPAFRDGPQVKVHVDPIELKEARSPLALFKGYIKGHLAGFDVRPIEYLTSLGPFEKAWDVFKDGSVWIVATPGHTPGHSSALVRSVNGPFFLTFDAAHRRANLDQVLPPKGNLAQGKASIEKIKAFLGANPMVKTIFGHDPDQVGTLKLAPQMLQ